MKPFSAAYYIKHNKPRSIALILMIASIVIIYVGGIYITSFNHMAEYTFKMHDEYSYIYQNYGSSQEEFDGIVEEFRTSDSVGQVLSVTGSMMLNIVSEMSIANQVNIMTFASKEDAGSFFETIFPDKNIELEDGEIALSSKMSKNCKLKVGDTINQDSEVGYRIDREYKIAQIIESDYFFAYGINKGVVGSLIAVRPKALEGEKKLVINQFVHFVKRYKENKNVTIRVYEDIKERIIQQGKAINYLYYGVTILLIIILSVAVNATFLGAYEKRQFEYSIYKAIGLPKRTIGFKIFKEVMLINLIGIGVAAVIGISVIGLANGLYYYSLGLGLKYFDLKSLVATGICDVLVIIPVVLFRVGKIRKYDITEY